MKAIHFVLVACLTLSACSSMKVTPKQATQTTASIAGGFAGSTFSAGTGQTISIIGGALLAKHIVEQLTEKLDTQDKNMLYTAQQSAFSSNIGEPVYWKNLSSGNRGIITATSENYSQSGQLCREFKHQIFINWRNVKTTGAACKLEDNNWRIVR